MVQWIQKVLLIAATVGVVGGIVVGTQLNKIHIPKFQKPSFKPPSLSLESFKAAFSDLDSKTADGIRAVSSGQVSWKDIAPRQSQAFMGAVQNATISAQVTMTPEEIVRIVREEGTAGLLSRLGEQTTVSVNGLSAGAIDAARYQYCLGVVESHQEKKQ